MRRLLLALALAPACYRDTPAPGSSAARPARPGPPPAARVSAESAETQPPHSEELARAERAFLQADMLTAKPLYEQAARSASQANAEYARYRLAWVHLNLDEPQAALEQFSWVATHAAQPALRRAAARDVVFPYGRVGRPDRALAFFDRIDRARAYELLHLLGEQYLDAGEHANARTVLRDAVTADPDPTRVCQARVELLRIASIGNARADVLAEAELLRRDAPRGNDHCRAAAEDLVTSLARAWQREMPKSNLPHADVIRMWHLAEALATSDAGKADAARERAALGGP